MIIAVTALGNDLNAALDPRFGRAQNFVLVDSDSGEILESITNPNVAAGGGAGIATAQMIANRGVKAIIAGSFGPNAFNVLNAAGIAMFSNAGLGSVKEAVDSFKSEKLQAISNPGRGHMGM